MPLSRNFSFLLKCGGSLALVVLADCLFWVSNGIGSNLGAFCAVLVALLLTVSPAMRNSRLALAAVAIASLFVAALGDDPGLLAGLMFCAALSVATLLPRVAAFGSVSVWLALLPAQWVASLIGPWRDLFRLRRVRSTHRQFSLRTLLPLLPLPIIGGSIFLALFAAANPLIGDTIGRLQLPELQIARAIVWVMVMTLVWALFRPRRLRRWSRTRSEPTEAITLPGVSVGSVTLSLLAFNLLFALQNGLDLAYLWSGSVLPDGMTLATYAHRGAYPLIATALLAGLFVLVTLQPGSDTAAVPLIRMLVVLWVGQNLFLVASSILRTLDYVDAYSLTRLRLAALLWMGLVAVGLSLILWRMLTGKSATWLINANALAGGAVLLGCSIIDLGSVAASWNVRHAREAGGAGAALDLCYLNRLGPSALVSLVELESRLDAAPAFRDRVAAVRSTIMKDMDDTQKEGGWTWRNARRLDRVADLASLNPQGLARPAVARFGRNCDGSLLAPPAPVAKAREVEPVTVAPPVVAERAASLTGGQAQ